MVRWQLTIALGVVVASAGASQAQTGAAGARRAGPVNPYYRPPTAVTPFVNLVPNIANSRVGVYQGIIRPQFDQNQFQQLQNQRIAEINQRAQSQQGQINTQSKNFTDLRSAVLLPSKRQEYGSMADFMNYRGYFKK